MPFEVVRDNIVCQRVDAIVNSANPKPMVGQGVDSAIREAAGPELLEERRRVGDIGVGRAAVTAAGDLPARMVVHTVGPVWQGGAAGEDEALASCYETCLQLAVEHECDSIAFPLLSTGACGFPKERALRIATDTIRTFLSEHDIDVRLVVYDSGSFRVSRTLFEEVSTFIGQRHIPAFSRRRDWESRDAVPSASLDAASTPDGAQFRYIDFAEEEVRFSGELEEGRVPSVLHAAAPPPATGAEDLAAGFEDIVGQVEEGFSEALLRMIDERGMSDPQVYRRANIDRKLFSKIRTRKDYQPSKATALGLAVALELNLDETRDLIGRAGYALTHANVGDIIVEYFIVNRIWDIFQINEILFAFDQPLIGR